MADDFVEFITFSAFSCDFFPGLLVSGEFSLAESSPCRKLKVMAGDNEVPTSDIVSFALGSDFPMDIVNGLGACVSEHVVCIFCKFWRLVGGEV